MSSLDQLVDATDLPALLRDLTGLPLSRLTTKGGTIHDPRPGHAEQEPSFSVYRNLGGTWMWKRRGDDEAGGTAYHLLLHFGYSGREAVLRLQEHTGMTANAGNEHAWPVTQVQPPDLLAQARDHQPLFPDERGIRRARRSLQLPVPGSAAYTDLARRGLLESGVLAARQLDSDLTFPLRAPFGGTLNVKVRHLGESPTRYSYRLSGLGSPAWVNPDYGDAPLLLIVEGELNAVAAFEAASRCGRVVDVQGLPGSDNWPLLQGLERDVRVYTDGDESGNHGWTRLHDLLHLAGASSVTRLPPLAGQDFCDVLAQQGAQRLNALLDPPAAPPHTGSDPTLTPGRISVPGEWPLSLHLRGGLHDRPDS